jgi:hypothetical protein
MSSADRERLHAPRTKISGTLPKSAQLLAIPPITPDRPPPSRLPMDLQDIAPDGFYRYLHLGTMASHAKAPPPTGALNRFTMKFRTKRPFVTSCAFNPRGCEGAD